MVSNVIFAFEKGFKEVANLGSLIGHPVDNIQIVLTDDVSQAIDSSEFAFNLVVIYVFTQCYKCYWLSQEVTKIALYDDLEESYIQVFGLSIQLLLPLQFFANMT